MIRIESDAMSSTQTVILDNTVVGTISSKNFMRADAPDSGFLNDEEHKLSVMDTDNNEIKLKCLRKDVVPEETLIKELEEHFANENLTDNMLDSIKNLTGIDNIGSLKVVQVRDTATLYNMINSRMEITHVHVGPCSVLLEAINFKLLLNFKLNVARVCYSVNPQQTNVLINRCMHTVLPDMNLQTVQQVQMIANEAIVPVPKQARLLKPADDPKVMHLLSRFFDTKRVTVFSGPDKFDYIVMLGKNSIEYSELQAFADSVQDIDSISTKDNQIVVRFSYIP